MKHTDNIIIISAKYWFVKPDYYKDINNILKSDFSERDMKKIISEQINGVYIMHEIRIIDNIRESTWFYIDYPDYDKNMGCSGRLKMKNSKKRLDKLGFNYMGDLSNEIRKLKIDKLNNI